MDVEDLQGILGRKWAIPILKLLSEENELNNKDIRQELEPASDTLSDTLSILQEAGWINREEHGRNDIRYSLTTEGKKAINKLKEIVE